jgi:hypothetical protein
VAVAPYVSSPLEPGLMVTLVPFRNATGSNAPRASERKPCFLLVADHLDVQGVLDDDEQDFFHYIILFTYLYYIGLDIYLNLL